MLLSVNYFFRNIWCLNSWKDYRFNIRYIRKIMINISKVQYIFHNSRVFEQASVKKKKKRNLTISPLSHILYLKERFADDLLPFSLGIKLNLGKSGFERGKSRLPAILQKKVATIFLKPILYAIWLIVAGTYTFPITNGRISSSFSNSSGCSGGNERFGNTGFPESQLSTDWHLKSFRSETFERKDLFNLRNKEKDLEKKKKRLTN